MAGEQLEQLSGSTGPAPGGLIDGTGLAAEPAGDTTPPAITFTAVQFTWPRRTLGIMVADLGLVIDVVVGVNDETVATVATAATDVAVVVPIPNTKTVTVTAEARNRAGVLGQARLTVKR